MEFLFKFLITLVSLLGFIALLAVFGVIIKDFLLEKTKVKAMSPEDRQKYQDREREYLFNLHHGRVNPAMICPHCNEKGRVRTKPIERKKGISGAKATGAIFTAGISLIATGLSRKEQLTQAHCGNCQNLWEF